MRRLIVINGVNLNSKWHVIQKGRVLNGSEIDFVVALIMGWIEGQLDAKGDLTE